MVVRGAGTAVREGPPSAEARGYNRDNFFFSSRRRHTRFDCDWSSDVCSSDLKSPTGNTWARARVVYCLPHSPKGFAVGDRKSTRLNSSHSQISYAVFCLKKKKIQTERRHPCRRPNKTPSRRAHTLLSLTCRSP